ncbi:DNA primase small subunit [Lipomyces oligophaga]|uniref:DNA primase small subunit n=1 Tax=Lipomyces oligophaga TaxID=45792 RepID=UPI0034CF7950
MPHYDSAREFKETTEITTTEFQSSPISQSSVIEYNHNQTSSSPIKTDQGCESTNFGGMFDDDFDVDINGIANIDKIDGNQSIQDDVEVSLPELMKFFYSRLFPFKELFLWLNHFPSPTASFTHREIAFTLQNDAYLRYQSFGSYELLKQEVMRLNPSRFEIGPVYSANPRDRKIIRKNAFKPLEKELVFDIDMSDYNDIRTCCQGTSICNKCWSFITVAIRVIDTGLREDFGFKHVLWVYSGRRGAHAWVCDKRARMMDDSKRRAILAYFELLKGGTMISKRVNLKRPLHPFVNRSLDISKENFTEAILVNQNPWEDQTRQEKLLSLLPDTALNAELKKRWSSGNYSSMQKWADIDSLAQTGISKTLDPRQLKEAKQDIILEYMYPRLDSEVSKHLNHLLKSPFCVHPGTGRVCVPINGTRPETFDPLDVPTVSQLMAEVDNYDMVHKVGEEKVADFEKTSLKPYVEYFHRFVADLMKDEMKDKRPVDGLEF